MTPAQINRPSCMSREAAKGWSIMLVIADLIGRVFQIIRGAINRLAQRLGFSILLVDNIANNRKSGDDKSDDDRAELRSAGGSFRHRILPFYAPARTFTRRRVNLCYISLKQDAHSKMRRRERKPCGASWRRRLFVLMFPLMTRAVVIEDMPPAATGRAGELPAPAPAPTGEGDGCFEAILYPHRSLPNAGFWAVMAVVIGVNLTLGLTFYAIGAWPVLGFCGLDVFLVWIAFKLSYRQGRLHEHVRVTADEMWVSRALPSGHETRWRMQPYWTRVEIDRPARHESQLCILSRGRTLVLGSFLSPKERVAFADVLQAALSRLRS